MKATLIKSEDSYILKDGLNHVLGIDDKKLKDRLECAYLLSKQNCDEIFGVVDVEEIADRHTFGQRNHEWKAYIAGFNKAMELNKDKVFTVEDIKRFVRWGIHQAYLEDIYDTTHLEKATVEICNQLIEAIQQPTEIEVEIEMELEIDTSKLIGAIYGHKPKLDSERCLILKKI